MPELLGRLRAIGGANRAWTAGADLRFERPRAGQSHEAKLRLAGRKPADLRMQATKPLLPTLFVLVANDGGVWLDVPSKHKTYSLPAGAVLAPDAPGSSLLSFQPAEFLAAVAPDAPAEDEQWTLVEEPNVYVLSAFVRAEGEQLRPTRELSFERRTLSLARVRLFGASGRLTTDAQLGEHRDAEPLPRRVRLTRPFDGITLTLEFDSSVTATLTDRTFEFNLPNGRELIDASTADAVPEGLPGAEETSP